MMETFSGKPEPSLQPLGPGEEPFLPSRETTDRKQLCMAATEYVARLYVGLPRSKVALQMSYVGL